MFSFSFISRNWMFILFVWNTGKSACWLCCDNTTCNYWQSRCQSMFSSHRSTEAQNIFIQSNCSHSLCANQFYRIPTDKWILINKLKNVCNRNRHPNRNFGQRSTQNGKFNIASCLCSEMFPYNLFLTSLNECSCCLLDLDLF